MHGKRFSIILTAFISGALGAALVIVVVYNGLATDDSFLKQLLASAFPQTGAPSAMDSNQPSSSKGKDGVAESPPSSSQETLVTEAVKRASPSVVSIVISKDVPIIERYFEESPLDPFGDFFFRIPQFRQRGTERREIGGGSGFLVSKDGLILTNRHVVSEENVEYTVFTNDGKKHEAEVVARDPVNDLAVLKIKGDDFPFLEFGDSDRLRVGQSVIAIGNALGEFRNTVSVGVISGLSRSITAGDASGRSEFLEGVIQTDAAINPGNSGGPLLNLQGRVIGVNVALAQGSQNIAFALPSKLARAVVESVKKTGKIVRPFLGVRYVIITPELKEKNKLSVDYGALIVRGETADELAVIPGSPADKAGLVENDIILEADGKKLDGDQSLASIIRNKNVGDTLNLKILHRGQEKNVTATLAELQ